MSTSPAMFAASVAWLKSLPPWGKGVMVGGALVLCSLWVIFALNPNSAVAGNAVEIQAVKSHVEAQQSQLDRIEGKMDRLILKLIPPAK